MATAFTALANITISGGAKTSITFSSISASYRDLYLVLTPVLGSAGGTFLLKANADAGLNYNGSTLRANGTTVAATNLNANNYGATLGIYATYSGIDDSIFEIWLPDYATTDKHKNMMIRASGATTGVEMNVSKWNNTAAITSLILGGYFGNGTTATLYGVAA